MTKARRIGAVVHAGLALGEWSTGDIERALDGAERATLDAGLLLGLVEAQVEEMLERHARHEQAELVVLRSLRKEADAGPEFLHGHVALVDHLHQR